MTEAVHGVVEPVIVRLGAPQTPGDGAVWSLPHGGDLDANLVHVEPGHEIGEHVNDEVDVLMSVRSGSGTIVINAVEHQLGGDTVVLVPKGATRRIVGGPSGVTFLSVHRQRGLLKIGSRTPTAGR